MKRTVYMVDGYNVIHRVPRWERLLDISLEQAREALLGYCARWIRERGDAWLIYVVFDGKSDVHHEERGHGPGVRAVYTRTGEEADDRILDIVREWGVDREYVVVSDDRYVSGTAQRLGARRMTSGAFAAVVGEESRGSVGGTDRQRVGKEVGLSQSDAKSITAELAALWGAE